MMDEGSEALEEGEIQDTVTQNMASVPDQFALIRATREPQRICSDESSNDNSDNSDDDSDACSKPKLVKHLPPPPTNKPQVPDKYKVWSIALQEEALMENLTKCDVEAMDRERSVESYNYRLVGRNNHTQHIKKEKPECGFFEEDFVECQEDRKYIVGNKRRHGDVKKRLGKRKEKSHHKRMPNLTVTAEDSIEDVAEDIAVKLKETKVNLILNVVVVLGKEKAIELYNETKEVEDNGGMMLMNGERRRTAGGVYFLLLKRDNSIASEAMKEIFAEDVASVCRKKKHIRKWRFKKNNAEIKENLIREKLLSLNTAVGVDCSEPKRSQTSVTEDANPLEEGEVELNVTNPPPSPATDQDTPPSRAHTYSEDETERVTRQADNLGRTIVNCDDDDDDDYLDVGLDVDDMDVF